MIEFIPPQVASTTTNQPVIYSVGLRGIYELYIYLALVSTGVCVVKWKKEGGREKEDACRLLSWWTGTSILCTVVLCCPMLTPSLPSPQQYKWLYQTMKLSPSHNTDHALCVCKSLIFSLAPKCLCLRLTQPCQKCFNIAFTNYPENNWVFPHNKDEDGNASIIWF